MEQLGGLDAAFLYCETPTMHLHVCGLILLDPSTMPHGYSYERIRSMAFERLPKIPSVRQKLAKVPFNLGRPFWVDDPDLDIDRHLHRVVLEPPGDERALADIVGDIASWPLRRDRPLWELWVIEGLADGRIAILVKMHHSTIDGVSGASMMAHLLDLEPVPPTPSLSSDERPARQPPSPIELLRRSVSARLAEPLELARLVPATTFRLATTLWGLGRNRDNGTPTTKPFTAPRTLFNATVTARRSVAYTDVALADIKTVKDAFGVTVNDVVTAVVGGALRHYLEDRGELPDRSLLAAAPVSVHDQTPERGGMTKVSVMFSTLATDEKDPVERLRAISAANVRAKEIHRMVGADSLMRWAEHFWLNAFALGARLYSTLHLADHHPVVHNLILSNVPGPPVPLYMAGARLVGLYPLGPITDGAGLNVTVLSEEDRVGFGVITCPDLVPRVWDLADAVPGALAELVAAAAHTGRRSQRAVPAQSRRSPGR
ncbi:MAG TPA: wax ester/triacylglycerol synthase family O-acyltransferase [Acidimicrobiales bacterium]|nr:wax ester/triacylglycerol synthase family O-acyltransferase [Acidimicrobiales bacterium]